MEETNNRTIAKNTTFLYFRMMFTMAVTLYTSRVILDILGVNDYGLYQTVGGVVAMLSFINGALSTGSSRFLTFELGVGDMDKLKRTFSSVLIVHVCLAIVIAIVAETAGLWFVYNQLVIPAERLDAAAIAYHLSILTSMISVTQVPYNASIISHEKMSVFAYMSIIEVSLKLSICYFLSYGDLDKLILYSILLCIVQISVALFYRFYCLKKFEECHYKFVVDKDILKEVLGYSGWNLFANTAGTLITQGSTILINIFFSPATVTARAVANQVNMAANQFIQNFRTAANPQIVKKYASGDIDGSKKLLLGSTKFSFYLMLMLALPICLVAKDLLNIWLKEVPTYTTDFLQLAIISSLFQVFDTSFYTALYAKGRIRENAIISPLFSFILFPIVYILFCVGASPTILAWGILIDYAILGLVVKPILLIKIVKYTWNDMFSVFGPCLRVSICASIVPLFCHFYSDIIISNPLLRFICIVIVSIASVITASWFWGIDKSIRVKLIEFLSRKFTN